MSETTGLQQHMLTLAQKRDLYEQAKSYAYVYINGVMDRNVG